MYRKSFTLFEVLMSLIIVGITLSLVLKIFTSNDNIETYYKLQEIENNYIESGVIEESENIKFQKN